MQVSIESISTLERRMTVSVPASVLDDAYHEKIKYIAKTAKLDGFRPGKVPEHYIKTRYGEAAHSDAIEQVVDDSFRKALKQEDIISATAPTITLKQGALGQPVEFEALFETYPVINTINFTLATIETEVPDITDNDIDYALQRLREHHQVDNDENLMQTLSCNTDQFNELKTEIKTQLEDQVKRSSREKLTHHVSEALCVQNTIDVPNGLIEQEINQLSHQFHQHDEQGHCHTDNPLPKEVREILYPLATRKVRLALLMRELVKQHQLVVKPEQIKAYLLDIAKSYQDGHAIIEWYTKSRSARIELEAKLLEDQVIDKLLENVQIIEKKVSYADWFASQQANNITAPETELETELKDKKDNQHAEGNEGNHV